jgi:protein disulfide-isomerase A6
MNRSLVLLSFLLACVSLTSAFYEHGSKVVKLTEKNFRENVINSKELWFVEFYAPWCGHCQRLTPEWEKLAGALEGIIKVGAVDMTTDQGAGQAYGIRGFPTIKFFGANKNAPVDYDRERSAREMINFAYDQAKKASESRLGGGSGGSSGYQQQNQGQQGGQRGSGSDQDVIVLTDDNFDELLMNSEDLWIVDFYAPWCGHCKNLEPEWNKAATELKGEVKVAKVDATTQSGLAQRFGIQSFPQIKLFPSGPKSQNLMEDFNGNRDSVGIVEWALEKKAQYKPVQKVEQLVDQATFDKYCTNLRGICFIAFLPHIYDSSASERESYISIFQELAKSNRANPVTFIWAQGGDYYNFEESLALGSGYPALVGLSVNKMKYATLAGSFNQKNIESFVRSLIGGKQPLFNLREVPKIKTVTPWDGKNSRPASYDTADL